MNEILIYFFRLGILGFGGPLALISQMQNDLVEKRKWIDINEFNSAFSLIKAMPGPVAFMVAVFLGKKRGGNIGGLLAAIGLVLPPAAMMIVFSLFFKNLQKISAFQMIMLGMQATALGVILGSLKGLAKNNIKDLSFWFLVLLSGLINFYFPKVEPIIIILFGLGLILIKKIQRENTLNELGTLFLVCLKAGAVVFGSGLAIVPMLREDVVNHYHWLTENEFLNALAFGQMTPGPVVITSTFIGHHVAGIFGAIVATIGIFLASFIHMMTWFPHVIKKLNGKVWINDFIFGAVSAVVGPIIVAVMRLYLSLEFSYLNILFLIFAMFLTLRGKLPLWAIIPGGGLIYYFLKLLI